MYLPTFSKLVNLLGERQEHFASELRLGSALLLFSIDLLVSSRFGLHTPFRLYMFIAQRNFSVKPQGVAPYWRIVNSPHDDVWLVKSTTAENKLCVIAVELRVAIAIRLLAGASILRDDQYCNVFLFVACRRRHHQHFGRGWHIFPGTRESWEEFAVDFEVGKNHHRQSYRH